MRFVTAVNRFPLNGLFSLFLFRSFPANTDPVVGHCRVAADTQLGHVLRASTTGKKATASNRVRCGHDGRVSGDDESIHKYVNINRSEGSYELLS